MLRNIVNTAVARERARFVREHQIAVLAEADAVVQAREFVANTSDGKRLVAKERAHLEAAFKKAGKLISWGKNVYGYGGYVRKAERDARANLTKSALDKVTTNRNEALKQRYYRSSDASVDPHLATIVAAEMEPKLRARELFRSRGDAKLRVRWDVLDVDGLNVLRRDEMRILLEDLLLQGAYSDEQLDDAIAAMRTIKERLAAKAAAKPSRFGRGKAQQAGPSSTPKVAPALLPSPGSRSRSASLEASHAAADQALDNPDVADAAHQVEWDDFLLWWHHEARRRGPCVMLGPLTVGKPKFDRAAAQLPVSRYGVRVCVRGVHVRCDQRVLCGAQGPQSSTACPSGGISSSQSPERGVQGVWACVCVVLGVPCAPLSSAQPARARHRP